MNLIVVMIDTLRKDHVAAYGNDWIRTPALDGFAERSLSLDRMYPEALPTIVARRSLFTGRRTFPSLDWHPWKGEVVVLRGWQPLREEDVTLPEILRQHGYVCGLVSDCHHMFKPGQNFSRGFHAYTHIRGQVQDPWKSHPVPHELLDRYIHPELGAWAAQRVTQHVRNTMHRQREEDYFPAQVFRTAAEWLGQNRDHEKVFLWVDCFDPHEPWDPPQEYVDYYDPGYAGREFILPREGDSSYLSPAELHHCRARYAAEVTLVDRWLGWFLNRIDDLGLWDDTAVVVMSDHGHPLGEHGIISKTPYALYPELIEVPFMIHIPGITVPGSRMDALVQFHDLAPTLLDVLDVPCPEHYQFEGRSFFGSLGGENGFSKDHIVMGYHENGLVHDGEWAYIFTQDPAWRRLFHVGEDPGWTRDLYRDRPEVVRRLHGLLEEVASPEQIRVQPQMIEHGVASSQ